MKKQLLFSVLFIFATLSNWAQTPRYVPCGMSTPCYPTIQAAINAAAAGDIIRVYPGTHIESNILVNKSLIIESAATKSTVKPVIAPAAEDANTDYAFTGAQNCFIIAANDVTIRNLTIDGQGNPALTAGKNNFRAGIVTLDASQTGGGVWNNLHVDNVTIKYAWRRGISIFPRTVAGTVIENCTVENTAYNFGMYLAGQSQVINNTVKHCFQGIVLNPDASTPAGVFKINGNTITEIGNFPGCYGDQYPLTPRYKYQPRAIQFDPVDPTFRTVEIKDNIINDNGSAGLVGTVGIYTRRANSASIIDNNTITLTSGGSWSVAGGSQAVGMLLGWSYENGFMVSNNSVTTSGYGMGVMVFGCGKTSTMPMFFEGNVLNSSASLHTTSGDGTGIYIANQYLYGAEQYESYVNIQNHNTISGFARGIDVEKVGTSTQPLTVNVHNNALAANTSGIEASTLSTTIDATNNWWGGTGPKDATLYPTATGSAVSTHVSFIPWWCDATMTTACPTLTAGKVIMNTTTGIQYTSTQLLAAFTAALSGQTLYLAGSADGKTFNQAGKTVYIVGTGTGILGQSVIAGAPTALNVTNGTVIVGNGVELTNAGPTGVATAVVSGASASMKFRHCIIHGTNIAACLKVELGGTADAGTAADHGNNQFLAGTFAAINNLQVVALPAEYNDWGSAKGPTIASNVGGDGGAIIGTGKDVVDYLPWQGGPITTASDGTVCSGATTVDIPIKVSHFNNVGSFALKFGYNIAHINTPSILSGSLNPAIAAWGTFAIVTSTPGTITVSATDPLPTDGTTLADGSLLFTLHFTFTGAAVATSLTFNDVVGTDCAFNGVAPDHHAFGDIPTATHYINGAVTVNPCYKMSGNFTYYNVANTPLTSGVTVGLYHVGGTQIGTDYLIANPTGAYEFPNLLPGTYEVRTTSTKPTAGSVNTTDAAQVNYWGTNPYTIEKVRFYAGDVSGGIFFITSIDAQRIQKYFVYGTAFDRLPWTFWEAGKTISGNIPTPTEPYPIITLGSIDKTVNFYGLCTGDFNRSFTPAVKNSASNNLSLIYGSSRQVSINQEFDLPVRVVNAYNVGAVSLILNFPAGLVEVKDVLMNGTGGQLDWGVNGNELRIGWNSQVPANLTAMDNLITIQMKTKETFIKGNSIKLSLAPDPLNELANDLYDVISDAVLSVDVVEASSNGLFELPAGNGIMIHNYPNPFTNYTTIAYTLPYNGTVTLEIRNILGNTVNILVNEMQIKGDHSVQFDASSLTPGVYTATISLNSKTDALKNTIKLIISK